MHKTGSSSIQDSLAGVQTPTIRYADFFDNNHSAAMMNLFGERLEGLLHRKEVGASAKWPMEKLAKLQDQLETELNTPQPDLIISAETLCVLEPRFVRKMHDMLSEKAQRLVVLAYVRDPVDFMSSAFQQRLKSGLSRFVPPQPNYCDRFAKFENILGRDCVHYRSFEHATQGGASIVRDFAGWVGLGEEDYTECRSNQSMSLVPAAALYAANQTFKAQAPAHKLTKARMRAAETLQQRFPYDAADRFRFSPDVCAAHLDLEDCDWMEKRLPKFRRDPPQSGAAGRMVETEADLLGIADANRDAIAEALEAHQVRCPAGADVTAMMEALLVHELAQLARKPKPKTQAPPADTASLGARFKSFARRAKILRAD